MPPPPAAFTLLSCLCLGRGGGGVFWQFGWGMGEGTRWFDAAAVAL